MFLSDFANYVWSGGWTASQAKSTEGNHEMVQDDFWRSVKVVGFNRFLRVKKETIRRITLVMFQKNGLCVDLFDYDHIDAVLKVK